MDRYQKERTVQQVRTWEAWVLIGGAVCSMVNTILLIVIAIIVVTAGSAAYSASRAVERMTVKVEKAASAKEAVKFGVEAVKEGRQRYLDYKAKRAGSKEGAK